jgi:crotonobetainyl-CoA:carnitine CoA-transferase CaiB-like acyl-CoA transferase
VDSAEQAPLAGVRVLDLTRILSGPYATMLLADLGADVVKVERPGSGDDTRGWGPPFWRTTSTYFAAINRGKRSVAVDLTGAEGRALVAQLARGADVLVENFRPGVMERLGLDYATLASERLIYATINGFGSTGPMADAAGTEVIVEAETGLMAMTGVPGGPPVRLPVALVDLATGMMLVNGVLAALLQRHTTGRGRRLEFPLYATAFSVLGTVVASASVDPESQSGRWGSAHPSIVPYRAFAARDGWVVLGAVNDGMWVRLCAALELPDDPELARNADRVRRREEIEAAIAAAVAGRDVAEVVACVSAGGALAAPVREADDASRQPQALMLIDTDGEVRFTRTPLAQFGGSLAPAPELGEHSRAVLAEWLALDGARIDALTARGVVS